MSNKNRFKSDFQDKDELELMAEQWLQQWTVLRKQLLNKYILCQGYVKTYWFKVGLFLLLILALQNREFTFSIGVGSTPDTSEVANQKEARQQVSVPKMQRSSLLPDFFPASVPDNVTSQPNLRKEFAAISTGDQQDYLKRFSRVAKEEMQRFGIPASVTLAIGLLNSHAGQSELAQLNNHFAITCLDNKLFDGVTGQKEINGVCYPVFQNAWTGFRAHSRLLTFGSMKALGEKGIQNPEIWINFILRHDVLSTDWTKPEIMNLINSLKLSKYDA